MPPPTNSQGLRGVVDAASSGSGGSVEPAEADVTGPDGSGDPEDSPLAPATAELLDPGDGGVLAPGAAVAPGTAVAPGAAVGVGDAGRRVGRAVGVAVGGGFGVGEGVGGGVGAAVGDGVGVGVGLGAVTTTVGPERVGSSPEMAATNVTGQEPMGS
jgi:hypothetical protein